MSLAKIRADYAALPEVLEAAKHGALAFHDGLAERPVAARYPLGGSGVALAAEGPGAEAALAAFRDQIAPYLSGSIGPRYLGFVTGGTTPAAMAGDWLVAAVDQNLGSPGDSIATQISLEALDWLLDLFDLPRDTFQGAFTTGATASNFLAILTAREWAGEAAGISPAEEGLLRAPALQVFSTCPHVSFVKVMGLAGLGRNAIRPVAGLPGREAMDPADLDQALSKAEAGPKMVVASAATVTTNDFDDLAAVAEVCRRRGAWLHVDAAFGIFARCWPERAPLAAGLELADSITGDGHKWLNVPYDCGFFFTRRLDLLEQACHVSAVYLQTGAAEPEFLVRGVEDSQRFRALPVWMTLKAYGRAGVRDVVAACCCHAEALGRWIEASPSYELLAPVRLNVVCFRGLPPVGEESDAAEFNQALLERVNEGGKVRMTPGAYGGKRGLRAAFSNWMTDTQDLDVIIAALEQAAAPADDAVR